MRRFLAPLLLILLASCSTYDKVAVWYKYRNDFHLPKRSEMARLQGAQPNLLADSSHSQMGRKPEAIAQSQPLLAGRADSAHIGQLISRRLEERDTHLEAQSRELAPLTLKQKARLYRQMYRRVDSDDDPRKVHTSGIFSLVCAAIAIIPVSLLLGMVIFGHPDKSNSDAGLTVLAGIFSILAIPLTIYALVTGIVGVKKVSDEPELYKSPGFAIAGVVLVGFFYLALFASLVILISMIK